MTCQSTRECSQNTRECLYYILIGDRKSEKNSRNSKISVSPETLRYFAKSATELIFHSQLLLFVTSFLHTCKGSVNFNLKNSSLPNEKNLHETVGYWRDHLEINLSIYITDAQVYLFLHFILLFTIIRSKIQPQHAWPSHVIHMPSLIICECNPATNQYQPRLDQILRT